MTGRCPRPASRLRLLDLQQGQSPLGGVRGSAPSPRVTRRVLLAAVLAGPGVLVPGEVLRGRFEQERRLAGFAHVVRASGRFVLAPGRGLIWQVEAPFAVRTVITPAGLVQQVEGEEALRLSAERLPFLTQLSQMLAGALGQDWGALDAVFERRQSGTAQAWEMELTPRAGAGAGMPFSRILVRGGALVESVQMQRPNGDAESVRFLEQNRVLGALSAEEQALIDSAK